jgi:hypothetical protein
MIWLKSLLGGVLAAVVGGCLSLVMIFIKLRRETLSRSIGVDVSLLRNPLVIVFLVGLFVVGFAISFFRLK